MPQPDYCHEIKDVAGKTTDAVDELGDRIMTAVHALLGMLALLTIQLALSGKHQKKPLQASSGKSII